MIHANAPVTTGTFVDVAAGTFVAGPTLVINTGAERKAANLSALVTLEAETDTITLTGKWQGSNDGSTWYDINNQQNVTRTALGTGTGGDDAVASFCVAAPAAVYGLRLARFGILVGVATGAAEDTYSIGYNWTSFDRERF